MLTTQKIKNIVLQSKHHEKKFGLDLNFKPDQKPKAVVLFIHGFNGFKDWGHFPMVGDYFAQNDFLFAAFNLSHNGTTLENPTEFVDLDAYGNDLFSTDLDDIGLVLDHLFSDNFEAKNEADLNKVFLIGHSRGGALAMLKAAEDQRVKGIATWGSIISTSHFWTPENIATVEKEGVIYVPNSRTKQNLPLFYAYYEDVLKNPERLNVEEKVKNLSIPALFAHGTGDTSIPEKYVHRLKEWKPDAEKFLVENANHTFGGVHPYLESELPADTAILVEKTSSFFKSI